ncbi:MULTISPECIES: response regulator transcription factor [unclassified Nitratiruptor]|uniref:response regulator transcription factor n=1 Tax=unclassified Nitratiruptor TaxID=2624044 RepID=UPI001914DB48|nr:MULTISPECIES: response regulator transcription factor [unclassified Nitratiruptor]BCD61034.1 two-component system response regulator [Nitratiruptor sp. YY08-10]BCD64966.1 two-component system response regulator [Nitratiruptor sp. YY08-14]
MKPKIVLIEDERDLLELLEYKLSKDFEVEGFLSTKKVREFLDEEGADLLIVDRNLPTEEGSEFVHSLRKEGYDIPVIFLTAKDQEKDIEEGFFRGADDYITKPFNLNELILRIKAVLRRSKPQLQDRVEYKNITLIPSSSEVFIDGEPIHLTKLEFRLLMEFVTNAKQVLSREYLLEHVWEDFKQERSVNVAIKRLKEKIDPQKKHGYIVSVRGVGYKLC